LVYGPIMLTSDSFESCC